MVMTMPFALVWKGDAHLEPTQKNAPIGKEFEGAWDGTLDVNGTTLRLAMKLSNGEGGASGTLVSLDQGGAEIPIASITQTGAHLKLVIATIGATYEGDSRGGAHRRHLDAGTGRSSADVHARRQMSPTPGPRAVSGTRGAQATGVPTSLL